MFFGGTTVAQHAKRWSRGMAKTSAPNSGQDFTENKDISAHKQGRAAKAAPGTLNLHE